MLRSRQALLMQMLLGWLVLGLWAAPLLAQMHRTLHSGPDHSRLQAPQVKVPGPAHDAGLLALFSGHGDSADCLLFDQACEGTGLLAKPIALLPTVAPALVLRTLQGLATARWAAAFDARGPPPLV